MTTILKQLSWGNMFSYGADNTIDLTQNNVTQLVGLNGVGKTSIPLIIQEILYGKNVKKTPKAKLANRYLPNEPLWAKLTFISNHVEYELSMSRKAAKVVVTLLANGEDISSHTAPNTLKTVEEIIGYEFDIFCQIIYQSSKASLEFLTSTDTQRKKFLISLFGLEAYLDQQKSFKDKLTEVGKQVANLEGQYSVYEGWLKQNPEMPDITADQLPVPPEPTTEQEALTDKMAELKSIEQHNKLINQNNAYKSQLSAIDTELLHTPERTLGVNRQELENVKIKTSTQISEKQKVIRNLEGKSDTCPMCKQKIDISDSIKLAAAYKVEVEVLNSFLNDTSTQIENAKLIEAQNKTIRSAVDNFERLSNLIDSTLPNDILVAKEITTEIRDLQARIKKMREEITKVKNHNEELLKQKAIVESLRNQRLEYTNLLNSTLSKLVEASDTLSDLEILRDAFGTNGLLSYKLEFLTKDLEDIINQYLEDLSKGEFQLSFILSGDKLNIEILHDGASVSISELSEGELGKVNVATVLAVRKLMENLSNNRINVLFLDEIMGVLDDYGREELINILLKEQQLNTFLVTHAYRHPLVPALTVIKEDRISRIENG